MDLNARFAMLVLSRNQALRALSRNNLIVLIGEVGLSVGLGVKMRQSTWVCPQTALCSGGPGLWNLVFHRNMAASYR